MKDSERVKVINGLPNKDEAAIFNVQQTGKCLFLSDDTHDIPSNIICNYRFASSIFRNFQVIIESITTKKIGN